MPPITIKYGNIKTADAIVYLYAANASGFISLRPILINTYEVDHKKVTNNASLSANVCIFDVYNTPLRFYVCLLLKLF